MKSHLVARSAFAAGVLLVVCGCEPLTEVNENPNAPANVSAQSLLPQALRAGVENTFADFPMLSHTGIWPQQLVEIQYPDEEQGHVRPENVQGFWTNYYVGPLKDIQLVIEKGRAGASPNIEAVGLIWRAYLFHLITDLWGDVPYSEALSLEADGGITTPVYDTQQSIYAALIQSLEDAATLIDAADTSFGRGDLLYADDVVKWRRFANSLRMRMAMRMSEIAPATAQAEFVAAYNAGGFQSNDDNAMLVWAGPPYENPFYENYRGRDDHGISATMVDTLSSLSDPRLELYAEPASSDGVYRGWINNSADPPTGGLNRWSRIGNFWRADGAGTPTAIMTYSEVLFLQAEAVQRGWITGVAATLYESAIRANMNQYDPWAPTNGPTDAEVNAYVIQASVLYSATPATAVAQVQLQKWIALYMNGHEAWANQRRTDLPVLVAGPDLDLTRLPVRLFYPGGEQSLNKPNLDAAVARQGGGLTLVDRMWWDVN